MARVVKPLTRAKIRKIIKQKIVQLEQRATEEATDKGSEKKKQPTRLKNKDCTDLLIYLNYTIFLKELIRQAKIVQMKENSNEVNTVQLNNIKNNLLRKFRG